MLYKASRFWGGMLSWTKVFMPDTIEILEDRIVVTKKKFFGLTSTQEEIKFTKIASVRLAKGFFTGHVIIETSGGASTDLSVRNFKKSVAVEVIEALRKKVD